MSKTTSFALNIPLLRWRELQLTTHGTTLTAKTLAPTQLSITGITRVALVCTATTSVAHRLNIGDQISITGANQGEYNRLQTITAVTTTTFTFSLKQDEAPTTPATGTIVGGFQPFAQRAIITVDSVNPVTFGPNIEADQFSLSNGEQFELVAPPGAKFDIADWYSKAVTLNQAIKVLFI